MNQSPYMLVRNLYLKGFNQTYCASFENGLNIIWGDMDTGKSSILNLIDYCLGGTNTHLTYDQIKNSVRSVFLEVDLNGNLCTFERILLNSEAPIKGYNCAYEDINNHYPMILSASSTTELPDGWISDFILDKLTITKVKIPESKTNPNSRLYRLSFRDLMKLLYLKQTRVGSESLLDYTNPVVFNKNYEIQKFVYNIHDDRVAEYQAELTQEKAAKNKLDNNLYVVNNFLRSINLNINKDEILNKKLSAEKDLSDIEFAETAFKENFELSSQLSNELSLKILEAKAGLRQSNAALESKKYEIKNYLSLKKTYETDLVNLKTSNSIRSSIDLEKMNPSLNVECPLCKTELKLSNPIILNEHIDSEVRSISNRLQGVSVAVERLLNERYEIEKDLQRQSNDLEKLTTIFDSEHKHVLSPLVTNIQIFERQKSSVSEAINELSKALLIKNKVSDIEKSIENKSALIERLKRDIDSVTEELKGIDDVLDELTEIYKLYLEGSGVQDNYGAYIDKKFTPFFREISYYKTSSGGVRTILSILSFIARMHYLILNGGNLPVFFMLDTPGQNIGRGKRKGENEDEESLDAETSDPALYDKIYKQLLNVIGFAKEKGMPCQIIVVDNDIPPLLSEDQYHLVKRFSKSGGIYDIGLIKDAKI